MTLITPVLFLLFNRPAAAKRVFDAIRQARPSALFVAADGPRDGRPDDVDKCEQTRRIIDTVDWDCEVKTLYRDKNIGCRQAVSSAINWFFANVEEGIILEDDCVPGPAFFGYCQELLEHYRHDARIMQICGLNVLKKWNRNGHSYFFSSYGPVWGWASWRRSWKYYDVDMKLWPVIRNSQLYEDFCQCSEESVYRAGLYDMVFKGEIDTWDLQWGFSKLINNGLSIIPSVNLISNIGFTADATHTVSSLSGNYENMEVYDLCLVLDHPEVIVRDQLADSRYLVEFMGIKPNRTLGQAIAQLLRRNVP